MHPKTPPVTVSRVADLLATVAAANALIAAEADHISNSRAALSLTTLARAATLTVEQRPGAQARSALAQLDPDLLLAGTSAWVARRRTAARTAAVCTAAARAATRWGTPSRLEVNAGEGEIGA